MKTIHRLRGKVHGRTSKHPSRLEHQWGIPVKMLLDVVPAGYPVKWEKTRLEVVQLGMERQKDSWVRPGLRGLDGYEPVGMNRRVWVRALDVWSWCGVCRKKKVWLFILFYKKFSLLQRIKRKLVGEEGRCRFYKRQRVKGWGNWRLSHSRWRCHTHRVRCVHLFIFFILINR